MELSEIRKSSIEHLINKLIKDGWKNVRLDNEIYNTDLIYADGKPNIFVIFKYALHPAEPARITDEEKSKIADMARGKGMARVAYVTIDKNKELKKEIEMNYFG